MTGLDLPHDLDLRCLTMKVNAFINGGGSPLASTKAPRAGQGMLRARGSGGDSPLRQMGVRSPLIRGKLKLETWLVD